MITWDVGSWTGSINKLVRAEVREHRKTNTAILQAKYPLSQRLFRRIFFIKTFTGFIEAYLLFIVPLTLVEGLFSQYNFDVTFLNAFGPKEFTATLTNLGSYLISAQVGVLGVISIALALITLIGQREASSTDVQLYYHESFAFEIVASSIALLSILCLQLLWPLQALLHLFDKKDDIQLFKSGLLSLHLIWLIINLAGLSHFITVTFRFVQQSARERLRERYTANVVQPEEMNGRLRIFFYQMGSTLLENSSGQNPGISFGFNIGGGTIYEIKSHFYTPAKLHDVRMIWVQWVAKRWAQRCIQSAGTAGTNTLSSKPMLMFTLYLDQKLTGELTWCRRRGGVPLTRFERFLLRRAFLFKNIIDET